MSACPTLLKYMCISLSCIHSLENGSFLETSSTGEHSVESPEALSDEELELIVNVGSRKPRRVAV